MGKAFFTFMATFIIGLFSLVLGLEVFGGYPELGTVVSIAIAGGLIVYFNEKKNWLSAKLINSSVPSIYWL